MKNRFRKITFILLLLLVTIIVLLIVSYFRYDIFLRQEVKVERDLRLLEMSNSIFHPFFNTGEVIDYYDREDSIIKGKTVYKRGKLVKRIKYYENGLIWFEIPIIYCTKHGTVKHFFDNGMLQYSVDYKYGFMDGKAIGYNTNGQVKIEINYKNDFKHGDYLEHDSLGVVILYEKYKFGQKLQ